ncbi:hypothetical protein P4O66_008707 [Electrophorus voltai]|uniref:Uncharacterized protein n=1 Tax=Electrophorus voltai TaxID=2609070 RepID=A0AAD9DX84_9TELE|nr:hypothetical protein P4O66_008707 [Electrophorus voltai]
MEACGTYPLKISARPSLRSPRGAEQEAVGEDENPSLLMPDAWPTRPKEALGQGPVMPSTVTRTPSNLGGRDRSSSWLFPDCQACNVRELALGVNRRVGKAGCWMRVSKLQLNSPVQALLPTHVKMRARKGRLRRGSHSALTPEDCYITLPLTHIQRPVARRQGVSVVFLFRVNWAPAPNMLSSYIPQYEAPQPSASKFPVLAPVVPALLHANQRKDKHKQRALPLHARGGFPSAAESEKLTQCGEGPSVQTPDTSPDAVPLLRPDGGSRRRRFSGRGDARFSSSAPFGRGRLCGILSGVALHTFAVQDGVDGVPPSPRDASLETPRSAHKPSSRCFRETQDLPDVRSSNQQQRPSRPAVRPITGPAPWTITTSTPRHACQLSQSNPPEVHNPSINFPQEIWRKHTPAILQKLKDREKKGGRKTAGQLLRCDKAGESRCGLGAGDDCAGRRSLRPPRWGRLRGTALPTSSALGTAARDGAPYVLRAGDGCAGRRSLRPPRWGRLRGTALPTSSALGTAARDGAPYVLRAGDGCAGRRSLRPPRWGRLRGTALPTSSALGTAARDGAPYVLRAGDGCAGRRSLRPPRWGRLRGTLPPTSSARLDQDRGEQHSVAKVAPQDSTPPSEHQTLTIPPRVRSPDKALSKHNAKHLMKRNGERTASQISLERILHFPARGAGSLALLQKWAGDGRLGRGSSGTEHKLRTTGPSAHTQTHTQPLALTCASQGHGEVCHHAHTHLFLSFSTGEARRTDSALSASPGTWRAALCPVYPPGVSGWGFTPCLGHTSHYAHHPPRVDRPAPTIHPRNGRGPVRAPGPAGKPLSPPRRPERLWERGVWQPSAP